MEGMVWKMLSIVGLTMFKFIAGPTLGYAGGFSLITTILITITGMMCSVVLFTYLGDLIKRKLLDRIFQKRKKFTRRNRRFITVWKKFGLPGVAILTPIIFTPIGGTILMAAFGTPKNKILVSMLMSAVFWSVVFSSLIFTFGEKVFPNFIR